MPEPRDAPDPVAVAGEDAVAVAPAPGLPEDAMGSLAATATQAARQQSGYIFPVLVLSGLALLVCGWLLPWYFEPTSGGVGLSPQDVVSRAPSSAAAVLLYVMGAAILVLFAGLGYDRLRPEARAAATSRVRLAVTLAGALAALLTWVLTGPARSVALFGHLSPEVITNSAAWMTITGFVVCAFAYGLRGWVQRHGGVAFTVVAFAMGGLFPFMFGQATDFVEWGAESAGIYILLALGLNVVVGFAGLLDLGYAAFYAIGAYTTASLSSSAHGVHLPFWVLIFLGAAVAGIFGVLLGAPTLRLRGDYLAIVTLGFGEIVPDMAQNNVLHLTGGPNGISGIDSPSVLTSHNPWYSFGLVGINPRPYFFALLLLIALVIVVLRNTQRSRLGRAWMAIREDEVAAAATGVNPVVTKLLAFAIGASVSGFAGAFFGAMLGAVSPDTFQFQVSVTALTTVVLGGIGNIAGVTIGAVLISFVIFWVLGHLQGWMGTVGSTVHLNVLATIDYSKFKFVVYGLILIGIMLLRPGGLIPSQARKVELEHGTESEALAAVRGTA